MGGAVKPRCAVVFLMILALGASLGLPAMDVLDAVYDESEAVPFEAAPSSSIVLSLVDVQTHQPVVKSDSQFHWVSLTRPCERRPEHRTWPAHLISNSLTILDHLLRC